MSNDLREKLEAWLGLNRDFLWKVMNNKEKVDSIFRDRSVKISELAKVMDDVEAYLDDLKGMLKKLYLHLYEAQDIIKKEYENRDVSQKFDEDLKQKHEAAEHRAQEEAELRRKMERERMEIAGKTASPPSPPKPAARAQEVEAAGPRPVAKTGKRRSRRSKRVARAKEPEAKVPAAPPAVPVPDGPLHTFEMEKQPAPGKAGEEEEEAAESDELPAVEFTVPEKIGGLVDFLGLADWFRNLKPQEQKTVVAIMASDGKMKPYDILEREITTLRASFAPYCWKTANKLMRKGLDELATGLLIKGLTVVMKKRDKEMLHIMYAKYFYRQRKVLNNAYDACINHCEKTIRSYIQDKEDRPKPVAPFKLLTMIYEEKNERDRIIDVCDRAIKLYRGSADESKVMGFLRIKEILEKKQEQLKGQKANPSASD